MPTDAMGNPDATKSYFLPISDLNLDDRKAIRANCDDVLKQSAVRLAIRDTLSDLIVRDILPLQDLNLAATDDWLIAGAGIAGTELQYISFAIPQDTVVAFYGLGVESATPSISRVRLTLGNTSSQVRGVFQIEQLYSRLETVGYMTQVISFTRQEICRIMVMPRLAFAVNSQRLHFLGRTIEPIGRNISSPSL